MKPILLILTLTVFINISNAASAGEPGIRVILSFPAKQIFYGVPIIKITAEGWAFMILTIQQTKDVFEASMEALAGIYPAPPYPNTEVMLQRFETLWDEYVQKIVAN